VKVPWLALAIFALAVLFAIFALIVLARARSVRYLPKWVWAVIICLSVPWGGLIFLIAGRGSASVDWQPPGGSMPPGPGSGPPAGGSAPLGGGSANAASASPPLDGGSVPPGDRAAESTSSLSGNGGAPAGRVHANALVQVYRSAPTVEVRRLVKHYGRLTAVDDLSFTVQPGHVTGFLGPNGAGKTTTMRLILGLATPTSGEALIGGRRYRDVARPLHEVGSLLDANAVQGSRTAWSHLLAIARSNRISAHRVHEVLELVGLTAVAGKRVGGFSLGMRQRLGLAVALLADPPVLIFDEPVNGLDPEGVRWIRDLLKTMAAQGRTILISSHLMSEMALTADHLIIIGRGRLLADTSVEAFVASSTHRDVLVRSPPGR
jgi:ABC-2 type transport system ATP-binding protein